MPPVMDGDRLIGQFPAIELGILAKLDFGEV
jgi:hypothetical protein